MPETKVLINLSNRHIHVSKEDLEALFGAGHQLTKTKDLIQPGQFACEETVTIKGPKGEFKGVRILGPTRPETQCEILASDVFKLGVPGCPTRESGQLDGSFPMEIVGPAGTLKKARGLIIAKRHVHFDPPAAERFAVKDKELVSLRVPRRARRDLRRRRLPREPELRPRVPPRLRRGQRRGDRQRQLRRDHQEMSKVVLKAQDLDGYLTDSDKASLERMDAQYRQAMASFNILSTAGSEGERRKEEKHLIGLYNDMGSAMQEICQGEKGIQVYSFVTPQESHGEASRLIAKLRDVRTGNQEFVYYIQRAYELLFNIAFASRRRSIGDSGGGQVPPHRQDAGHRPRAELRRPQDPQRRRRDRELGHVRHAPRRAVAVDHHVQGNPGVLVLRLRHALRAFKIRRDDTKSETDMEYIMDLERSYFRPEELDGKDLIFADPMNATGGSLVTVVKYLLELGIKPKSVKCLNVIAALKGALRITRAVEHATVYTLWMDPMLNDRAYIMPGLGDAGDRINGRDEDERPRDILQLNTYDNISKY